MALYDFTCSKCGAEYPDVRIAHSKLHAYSPACDQCHSIGTLQRVPAASSFVVKGFSAKNGYSKKEG